MNLSVTECGGYGWVNKAINGSKGFVKWNEKMGEKIVERIANSEFYAHFGMEILQIESQNVPIR